MPTKGAITTLIAIMLKADTQYKNLMEEIKGVRIEVAGIDEQLTRDRHDIEDFKVQMASMKSEIEQLRHELVANASNVKNKVSDALVQPMKDVAKLSNEIKNAKKIVIVKNSLVDWIKKRWMGKIRTIKQEIREEVKGSG